MKGLFTLGLLTISITNICDASRFSNPPLEASIHQKLNSEARDTDKYKRGAGLKRLNDIRSRIQNIKSNRSYRDQAPPEPMFAVNQPMEIKSANPFYEGTSKNSSSNPFATPSVVGQYQAPINNVSEAQINAPRIEPTQDEDNIIKLLTKCEKLGPFIDKQSEQGDKARDLYGKHCNVVVEQLALKERLDVFYRIHGTYLAMLGNHKDANTYLTHYYQVAPQEFDSNYLMIQNLADLGHHKMAMDMLQFFRERNLNRSFSIIQEEKLKKLFQYAKATQ